MHYDKDLIIDTPSTKYLNGLPDMDLRWDNVAIPTGFQGNLCVVTGDLAVRDGILIKNEGQRYLGLPPAIPDWTARGLVPEVGIELLNGLPLSTPGMAA